MVNLPPAIEFHNAAHTYQTHPNSTKHALQRCNIHIMPGEWVSVMGTNGSGKSTLARLCKGFIAPSAGEVRVWGISTTSSQFAALHHEVAYLSQDPEHHVVGLTVADDIALTLRARGLHGSDIRKRMNEALEAVGMLQKADREFSTLSGGEMQLAALAGILACRPQLIVLDEPTAYADEQTRQKVWRVIQRYHERTQPTILWVTHNRREASLAQRTIVLHDGAVVYDGFTSELWLQDDETLFEWGIEPTEFISCTNFDETRHGPKTRGAYRNVMTMEMVCFRYDELSPYVIEDMDLHVGAGERVALTGPVGSGKSTLIHLLTGLEQHEKGRITVVGNVVPSQNSGKKKAFRNITRRMQRHIALCLQQPELQLYEASVEDEFHALFRYSDVSTDKRYDKMKQVLSDVGLDLSILKRSPFTLSGGERRKVGLALALASDVPIYILDEPTVGLDYPSRVHISRALLAASKRNNAAMFISTHDEYIVQTVTGRRIRLGKGKGENNNRSDTLGSTRPADTSQWPTKKKLLAPVHRIRDFFMQIDPRLHVIAASLLALTVSTASDWQTLLYGFSIATMLSLIAKVSWQRMTTVLLGLLPFALAATIFAPASDAHTIGTAVTAYVGYGAFVALRLSAVMFSVMWVTEFLPLPDIMFAMRSMLKPLRHIGIPIGLLIGGTLVGARMLPIIMSEGAQLRRMQYVRGQRQMKRHWYEHITGYVIPLSAAVMRRAERLGEALQAKGFTRDVFLTSEPFTIDKKHFFFIGFIIALLSGFVLLAGYGGSMT